MRSDYNGIHTKVPQLSSRASWSPSCFVYKTAYYRAKASFRCYERKLNVPCVDRPGDQGYPCNPVRQIWPCLDFSHSHLVTACNHARAHTIVPLPMFSCCPWFMLPASGLVTATGLVGASKELSYTLSPEVKRKDGTLEQGYALQSGSPRGAER